MRNCINEIMQNLELTRRTKTTQSHKRYIYSLEKGALLPDLQLDKNNYSVIYIRTTCVNEVNNLSRDNEDRARQNAENDPNAKQDLLPMHYYLPFFSVLKL